MYFSNHEHNVRQWGAWSFLVTGNWLLATSLDTALRLAHFFGTSPEFWLNLQSLHEIRLAEQKSGKSIKTLPTLRRAQLARA